MNTPLTDPDCPQSVRDQINGGVTQEALTYGQKLIAEAIEAHFGEEQADYDEDVDDTSNHDAWLAFNKLATAQAERGQLEARVKELETDCARLEDELDEARGAPWPEWATKVLSIIRSRSGYDGSNDFEDGVDIPGELEEAFSELEHAAARAALQEPRP